jgi:hypothetical protein
VTSGGIRCSKETPIIKKSPTPPFLSKGGTMKEGGKKNKSLDIEQIYGHGSQWDSMPGPCDRAGWLPAVSYCSALLCSAAVRVVSNSVESSDVM